MTASYSVFFNIPDNVLDNVRQTGTPVLNLTATNTDDGHKLSGQISRVSDTVYEFIIYDMTDGKKLVESSLKYFKPIKAPVITVIGKVEPAPPAGQATTGPTTMPLLGVGYVEGTGIDFANQNREHVCDLSIEMKLYIAEKNGILKQKIQAIRDSLEALYASDGASSPFMDQVKSIVNKLKAKLQKLKKIAEYVGKAVKAISEFIEYARNMIAYILSLPAQLAQFFAQCLQNLQKSLSDALNIQMMPISNTSISSIETDIQKNQTISLPVNPNTQFSGI